MKLTSPDLAARWCLDLLHAEWQREAISRVPPARCAAPASTRARGPIDARIRRWLGETGRGPQGPGAAETHDDIDTTWLDSGKTGKDEERTGTYHSTGTHSQDTGLELALETPGASGVLSGSTFAPSWGAKRGSQPALVVPAGAAFPAREACAQRPGEPGDDGLQGPADPAPARRPREPLADNDSREAGEPSAAGAARSEREAPLEILVVEDDGANRRLVKAILGAAGHRLTFAGDGVEAVELAARHSYSLILMDYQMPRMDGLAAARWIRSSRTGSWRAPIVGLTAFSAMDDQQRWLAAGMDHVLHKPIDPVALEQAVRRWARRPGSDGVES